MKKLTFLLFLGSAFAQPLDGKTIGQIDQFVAQEMKIGSVPGVQIVALQDGQVVYARGYGYADLATKRPMTPTTPVIIGSTTKAMTALALMQLVEQGKLDLDKKVIDYLPWFAMDGENEQLKHASDEITLRQLLNHTAGIPSGVDFSDYKGIDALENRARELSKVKMNRFPGKSYEYCNDCFTLAGLIIEKISKMPYETYMEQNIFEPLLMKTTTFDLNIAKNLGLAQGYAPVASKLAPKDPAIAQSVRPAGLAISNVMDISNYLKMWLDDGLFGKNKVIDSKSIDEMWEKSSKISEQINYGLGWFLSERDNLKFVDHAGDTNITSSEFIIIPERNIAVGVLANRDNILTTDIANGIIDILLGNNPALSQIKSRNNLNTFKPDVNILQKYIGDYDTSQGLVKVFMRDDKMYATLVSLLGIEIELDPISNDRFVIISNISQINEQEISFSLSNDNKLILFFNDKPFGTRR